MATQEAIGTPYAFVENRENQQIKVIKDIAAASISILIWNVVTVPELSRLWFVIWPG